MARGRRRGRKADAKKKEASEKVNLSGSPEEVNVDHNEKEDEPKVRRDRSNVRKGLGGKGNPTKLTIEHCKSAAVFKQTANKVVDSVSKEFPDVQSEVNSQEPRNSSFEVTVTFSDESQEVVWSGIELGPPRKLKLPEADKIIAAIKELM